MPPLRPEEEWARQLMAAELGAVVVQHDEQSQDSMYDLKSPIRTARSLPAT
jgi:hypothetical protein